MMHAVHQHWSVSGHLMTSVGVVGHDFSYNEYEMWNDLKSMLHRIHLKHTCTSSVVIMVALWNRADHYIFILSFVLSFFFSSPNLSRRRLDVCHTSTHGVALVRI